MNFTNPAGLVTEAIREVLGDRASGSATRRRGSAAASPPRSGASPEELWFDYFGLNHLGWLRGVHDGERDLLPGPARRRRAARRPSRRASSSAASGCARCGMIPNEYLYFYYFASDTVGALRSGLESRGGVPAPSAGGLLRRERSDARGGARRPGGATRREREETYFAEAHAAAGLGAPRRDRRRRRRLRGRSARRRRGDRAQRAARADPRHGATAAACRSSTRRPSSRCRASSAAPARCRSRSATCPGHARALDRVDQGGRAD